MSIPEEELSHNQKEVSTEDLMANFLKQKERLDASSQPVSSSKTN